MSKNPSVPRKNCPSCGRTMDEVANPNCTNGIHLLPAFYKTISGLNTKFELIRADIRVLSERIDKWDAECQPIPTRPSECVVCNEHLEPEDKYCRQCGDKV